MKNGIKKFFSLFIVAIVMSMSLNVANANAVTYEGGKEVNLYRYVNVVNNLHFYTTNFNELGNGKSNYKLEKVEGIVSSQPAKLTIPLYRYCRKSDNAHFYTVYFNELGNGNTEYLYEGIACYVFPAGRLQEGNPDLKALYRYCRKSDNARFYTTNFNELKTGNSEYLFEGIACAMK